MSVRKGAFACALGQPFEIVGLGQVVRQRRERLVQVGATPIDRRLAVSHERSERRVLRDDQFGAVVARALADCRLELSQRDLEWLCAIAPRALALSRKEVAA